MLQYVLATLVFFYVFNAAISKYEVHLNSESVITAKTYAIWKNATVPFYVNPEHFDHEQTLSILTALSMFAFKTCVKFKPVMARPASTEEVMVFFNPHGTRRCEIETRGHSVYNPHLVELGYECLKSPDIEMIVMKVLGFPFEHNRYNRDLYIEVLQENIIPGALELFTKEDTLPLELRFLPYDVNSVMHFGPRDYSKNGHRTILFKDRSVRQNRVGLTETDLKKIELIYGPECRARDRQEKIDLCQSYPGVARKKREADNALGEEMSTTRPNDNAVIRRKRQLDTGATRSLRVNPDITPPPELQSNDVELLKDLGIDQAVQELVEHVHKVSSLALRNARNKYCNNSETKPIIEDIKVNGNSSDILGIIEVVANFAKGMVDDAVRNLTQFCEVSDGLKVYQRFRCNRIDSDPRCREAYKPTTSERAQHSTQHRPNLQQSIKHFGEGSHVQDGRTGNGTESVEETPPTKSFRSKREESTEKLPDNANRNERSERSDTSKATGENAANDQKEAEIKEKTPGEKIVDAEKKQEVKDEGNKKTVNEDKPKINDKDDVRARNMAPDTNRNKNNRRNHQKKHRGKRVYKDSEEDNSKSREKRKERRGPTKKKERKEEPMAIPLTVESDDELKKVKDVKNYDINDGEGDLEQTLKDNDGRQQKNRKPKKEKTRATLPNTIQLSEKNEEFYSERRWPDGELFYMIQEDTAFDLQDLRRRLEEVNKILKKKTCVRMIEITPEEVDQYEDYIVIDASPDYVTGRVGGKQNFGSIELFQGGQHRQHAAMMVMAMLGFYFEVSRHDRDKYIRVHMRHVRPDKLHHFEVILPDATLPLPYDYASATHPAWQFWRQLGITGISTVATFKDKDPDGVIMKSLGQNKKLLSDIDIVKINSVYGVECFKHQRMKSEDLRSANENMP